MDTESKQGEPAAKLPHFITEARPLRVPTELLALAPGTEVSEEYRIGSIRGGSICTAADYREKIEATIARHAEDFFTVDEAAQVLADARGLDPAAMVHTLRTAQDEGELVIRDCATRLRQGKSDHRRDRRDFLDLVKGADIDAWLTASGAGYGFPAAPSPLVHLPNLAGPKARPMGDDEWRELAREESRRIIKRQAAVGRFPSQQDIADEVAADFRKRTPPIHGADGKPLSGATIKRHALKGISSATKKARATPIHRGK